MVVAAVAVRRIVHFDWQMTLVEVEVELAAGCSLESCWRRPWEVLLSVWACSESPRILCPGPAADERCVVAIGRA